MFSDDLESRNALWQPVQLLLAQIPLHIFDTLDAAHSALSPDGGVSSDLFCSVVSFIFFHQHVVIRQEQREIKHH